MLVVLKVTAGGGAVEVVIDGGAVADVVADEAARLLAVPKMSSSVVSPISI